MVLARTNLRKLRPTGTGSLNDLMTLQDAGGSSDDDDQESGEDDSDAGDAEDE